MRGKPGTQIVLTIQRKDADQLLNFTLTREEINVKSVRANMIEPGYGYIRIRNFQERTGEDLARALRDFYKKGELKGLVLDVRRHCVRNPKGYEGYGAHCWGMTASDNHIDYKAHSPTRDLGVITPTAALSAFPYAPPYSMQALRHFYDDRGDQLWGEYGFRDAFNPTEKWTAETFLAIDQGPIIAMIENYRTGLVWKLFMSCPEVKEGLRRLEFDSAHYDQPIA
jgi:hypothetical protein